MLLALLACHEEPTSTRRIADPGRPGLGDSADTAPADDTAPGDDTATGPTDTEPTDTEPTDTEPTEPVTDEVCWLGPARDHRVCVPTVPWEASFGGDYDYPDPYGGSSQYLAPVRYVDLEAEDPGLEIAPNFVLEEYMAAWKGRWGVLQAHHVDELQAVRDAIGGPLTVTSGYRNPAYNAGVGGVTYSRHQYGDASDLDASGWSVEELGAVCDALGADYVGLYEDGHTHCDWRDAPLDPAFFPAGLRAAPAPAPAESARLLSVGAAWEAPAAGFDEGEPFRRWRAWDADGRLIQEGEGRRYVPPAGAVHLSVVVGGRVQLDQPLDAPAR